MQVIEPNITVNKIKSQITSIRYIIYYIYPAICVHKKLYPFIVIPICTELTN